MIDDIVTPDAGHRRRMEAGELSEAIAAFASDLAELGHAALTIAAYECSARHLGAWMALSGVDVRDLDDGVFQRFARHRCRCGGSRGRDRLSTKYINRARRFAYFLGERGLAPRILVQPEPVTFPPLVTAFVNWLRCHRGLSERTISRHARMISRLLPALGADPGAYDAACVRTVILDEGCRCSAAHVKTMAMALRGYLRFLVARGACRPCLDHAVPPTPEWRLSALPRYLPAQDIDRLIDGCDVSQSCGIRDRAILLLLARLGLRAQDIMAMTFGDIDWAAGRLRVCGKQRRETRLPLPQEVGDALLDYIERARPSAAEPRIFLRSPAPHRPFANANAVSCIVRSALKRAGITDAPSQGAHLLRHSAATAMLQAGATLDQIGAVLRHASPDTTAHYAKVDIATLRLIAQPWPGEAPC